MGARHSKRSVDISAAAKKDKESTSEEKLERIDDSEAAKQNGTTPRPDEPKEGSGDAATPEVNGDEKEETKEGETAEKKEDETEKKEPQTPESPAEEAKSPEDEKSEKKKKDKSKKKTWSFRSISFTRKDKSKPNMSKDDSITNDLAKIADTVAEVVEGETAAATEEKKETADAPAEEKKEEKEAPAAPFASAISAITSAASTAVEEAKEKVEEKKEEVKSEVVTKAEEIIEEGKAIVQKTVEQVIEKTSSLVESSASSFTTTVVESTQVITSSSQLIKETLEIKSDESPAPPLPASPPPTEAPPPTPNVVSPPEHEEVNGGGEGMAEMPDENGLGSDAKIDDDEEEVVPKLNGHNDVSPVKQVENIIDAIKSEAVEKTILTENNGELVTTQEALKTADE